MRQKSIKKLTFLTMPLVAISLLAGCGGGSFDPTTSIYIEPFSGSGFGYTWIEDLAAEWKAETGYQYNMIVDSSSVDMAKTQLTQIESGVSKTDIFFGGEPFYKEGIYKGYFENIEDLLEVKPDGEGGKTIKEKITNWDMWKTVGAKATYNKDTGEFGTEGMYMLPYTVTMSGLIFDYDSFEEKGFLIKAENNNATKEELTAQGISFHAEGQELIFDSSTSLTNYTAGRTIMRAGKDGKYGTYDDGQPVTLAEYNNLIQKIAATGAKPYVFSSQGDYLDQFIASMLVEQCGSDLYDALIKFNSNGKEIEMYDGTSKVITWDNGYEAYKTKYLEEVLKFASENFFSKEYAHIANQVSFAQNNYINGLIGGGEYYAFINDGNWFENEAAETFKAAAKKGGKQFGKNDLRFLLTPSFDGQKGIDGTGKGSFIAGPEYGAIVVRKQEDAKKLEAIKSFLSYVLRNDSMAKTNVKTGLIWGYDYDISDELKSEMTIFQKNCYELYHDTENVRVLCHTTDKLSCPFSYSSRDFIGTNAILPAGANGQTPCSSLRLKIPYLTVTESIRNNYTKETWDRIIEQAKTQLG